MRKFYAAIALCITLIGTLSPVFFSVSLFGNTPKINVEKNVVDAGTLGDTFFGRGITVENIPGDNTSFNMSSSVRYNIRGYSQGDTLGLSAIALHYKVVRLNDQSVIVDGEFDETDYFKNNEEKTFKQKIPMPADGTYLGWFYEDILFQTTDVDSSKVQFVVSGGKITTQRIDASTTNQDSEIKVSFSIPEGFIDPVKPDEIKVTGAVFYKNSSQPTPSTDNAPVNISWVLTDINDREINRKVITGISGKVNQPGGLAYTFVVNNLITGTAYKIHIEENEIKTNGGKPVPSAPLPFTAGTPVDNAAIQQQIQQQNADAAQQALNNIQKDQEGESKKDFECGIIDVFCSVYTLIIDFILFIPNGIATVAGIFMDVSLKIAISPVMYGLTGSGLESGLRSAWTIIRDFSNIGFIFALFIAAFSLILNKDIMGFEPKKTVVRVIIMALLVNFSFMMCRVVIQTADLFANIFYNKIEDAASKDVAVGGLSPLSISALFTNLGIKSPSLAIISIVNPQTLLLSDFVDDRSIGFSSKGAVLGGAIYAATNDVSVVNTLLSGGTQLIVEGGQAAAAATLGGILVGSTKSTEFYVSYGIIAVTLFFVYLILIYVFVSSGFIFLGRIVGLWLSIIVAPLAFVGNAIPMLSKNKYIGFDSWLNNLVKLSFLTPIFLFFVYLTVKILAIKTLLPASIINNGNMFIKIFAILFPLFIAAALLIAGKKIATEMSGAIGEMVGKVSGWATTAALGAATGGTAMLGRQTLGRAGSALANANRGDNSFLGKGMRTMGDKLGAASFDVRKNERAMKGFGKFTEMSGEKIDLGTRGLREGGFKAEGTLSEQYRKRQEHIAKEQEEKLKKEAADALLDAQAKDAQELRERQAKLEAAKKAKEAEDARIAMEAENQGPEAFIDKKEKEKEDLKNQNIQLNVEKLTVENEKTTLSTEKADIENDLSNLESEKTVIEKDIQQLQTAAAAETDPDKKSNIEAQINFQKEDLAKKNTEIDNKKVELQNKNIQIQDRDKTIAEKDKEIKENDDKIKKADAYQNNLSGITSVRDARQKKIELELEALHSQEKTIAEKSKAEMDKKKTEADEVQSELNKLNTKLKNEKDETKKAQIEADIAEKTAERNKKDTEYNKAKSDHKAAKQRYDDAFGNKITALSDFEKEALKTYEQDHEVQIRKATAQNAVIAAQKDVNASQNNLDNLNYQYQQKYAEDLEKKAAAYQKVFGRMTQHVATATGGLIGGEALNNAGENAATGVRRDVTGK